ncbi:VTC domain-containing protein [Zopfochytrium polystomum]|nr:VTC domain-containing protein [Zopfochytrium polystomum]
MRCAKTPPPPPQTRGRRSRAKVAAASMPPPSKVTFESVMSFFHPLLTRASQQQQSIPSTTVTLSIFPAPPATTTTTTANAPSEADLTAAAHKVLKALHHIPIAAVLEHRRRRRQRANNNNADAADDDKLVALPADASIKDTLQTMRKHNILAVPVYTTVPIAPAGDDDGEQTKKKTTKKEGRAFRGIVSIYDVLAWTVFQKLFDHLESTSGVVGDVVGGGGDETSSSTSSSSSWPSASHHHPLPSQLASFRRWLDIDDEVAAYFAAPVGDLVGYTAESAVSWTIRSTDPASSLLQMLAAPPYHRILVVDVGGWKEGGGSCGVDDAMEDDEDEMMRDEEDVPGSRVVLLTQTDLLTWLMDYRESLEPHAVGTILGAPLSAIESFTRQRNTAAGGGRGGNGLGSTADANQVVRPSSLSSSDHHHHHVITVPSTFSALAAFRLMYIHRVPAVAVVAAGGGGLVANLSASDLRGLTADRDALATLLLPVFDYLEARARLRPTAAVAAAGAADGAGPTPLAHDQLRACEPDARLQDAVEEMVRCGIHRVWIVEEGGGTGGGDRPVGCVSMSDVLAAFVPPEEVAVESSRFDKRGAQRRETNARHANKGGRSFYSIPSIHPSISTSHPVSHPNPSPVDRVRQTDKAAALERASTESTSASQPASQPASRRLGHLDHEVFDDWRFYAVDYRALKGRLKAMGKLLAAVDDFGRRQQDGGSGDDSDRDRDRDRIDRAKIADELQSEEVDFIVSLDTELDKVLRVFAFCNLKRGELNRRIEAMESTIAAISQSDKAGGGGGGGAGGAASTGGGDGDTGGAGGDAEDAASNAGSHDDREAEAEATRFRLKYVDEEIGKVTGEVRELARFAGLNHTAIMKILKKHDKQTGGTLKTDYMVRLNKKPFFEETYENMILRLSEIWDQVRYLHGGASTKDKSPGVDAQNIVRKTTKYWVHLDNVLEVKLLVLKHLPVLLFKKGVPNDPALNSIYFDNDELDLYHTRMRREEQAQNLRFRWYGKRSETDEVWVERKTHHEQWTGSRSIKERFPIKEKYLNAYLAGEYDIRHTTNRLRAEGKKKPKDIDDMERLADEVQQMVLKKKLRPMIRTSYNRTAFQLPADARVRISLDTELCLVREDGPTRSGANWRRDDSGYPYADLPRDDVIKFPYAVLEIKLQTQFGQAAPRWALDLAASHLVEAVPKFSKFHHAVSMFHTAKVQTVPFWFYQMDRPILKPRPPEPVSASAEGDEEDRSSLGENEAGSDAAAARGRAAPGENVKVDRFGKVFFSNERTFLRWLNFSIQLMTLSLFLTNLGPTPSSRSVGALATLAACGVLLWSLCVFHLRASAIRLDISAPSWRAPFELVHAPRVVVGGMMAAVVVAAGAVVWQAVVAAVVTVRAACLLLRRVCLGCYGGRGGGLQPPKKEEEEERRGKNKLKLSRAINYKAAKPRDAHDALTRRIKAGRQIDAELADFFKERALIEERYSADLLKLSKRTLVAPRDQLGGVHDVWQKVLASVLELSQAHAGLASDLSDKIERWCGGCAWSGLPDIDLNRILKEYEDEVRRLRRSDGAAEVKGFAFFRKSKKNVEAEKAEKPVPPDVQLAIEAARDAFVQKAQPLFEVYQSMDEARLANIRDAVCSLGNYSLTAAKVASEVRNVRGWHSYRCTAPRAWLFELTLKNKTKKKNFLFQQQHQKVSDRVLAAGFSIEIEAEVENFCTKFLPPSDGIDSNSAANSRKQSVTTVASAHPHGSGAAGGSSSSSVGAAPLVDAEGFSIPPPTSSSPFNLFGNDGKNDSDDEDDGTSTNVMDSPIPENSATAAAASGTAAAQLTAEPDFFAEDPVSVVRPAAATAADPLDFFFSEPAPGAPGGAGAVGGSGFDGVDFATAAAPGGAFSVALGSAVAAPSSGALALQPQQQQPQQQPRPVLNATLSETVNALFSSGVVERLLITGEISVELDGGLAAIGAVVPGQQAVLTVNGIEAIERIVWNEQFVQTSSSATVGGALFRSDQVAVDVAAVALASAGTGGSGVAASSSSSQPVVVAKYQVRIDESEYEDYCPLLVSSTWKSEPTQTSVLVAYQYNTELKHKVPLRDVRVFVTIDAKDGGSGNEQLVVSGVQTRPNGAWDAARRTLVWSVGALEPPNPFFDNGGSSSSNSGSVSPTLSAASTAEPHKLLARFVTGGGGGGGARPGTLAVQFAGDSVLLSGVDLSCEDPAVGGCELRRVERRVFAGRYGGI